MRVLIADRNVRLLETISLAFAHQFSIHTASTGKRCADLLQQSEFDLVIVCEKLADGPGLQLLGQIARSSPDTLRIFAARGSRLQLLKGRLRPFGLFRTLSYPIDARRLLSTLTLARAGLLQIDTPAPGIAHDVVGERQSDELSPTITSLRNVQPSELSRERAPPVARQATNVVPGVKSARSRAPAKQSAPTQAAVARSATSPRSPSQSASFQRALARREAAKRAASEVGGGWIPLAQSPPPGSLPDFATASHPTRNAKPADAPPKRATVFFGATLVAVFLVTTLTLRLFDATARSSSQTAPTTKVGGFSALHSQIERHDLPAPSPKPSVAPARNLAQLAVPKPNSARPDVPALESQMAADNTPIADPSTFGSEAAEPIYANN